MKKCEICELDRKYTQVMTSGRVVCSGCYLEYYASQCDVNHRGDTPQTPQNVSGNRQNYSITKRKVRQQKMLTLNYTVSKEDTILTTSNMLMINERQINDLMESLVANGFTVEAMSVAPATL